MALQLSSLAVPYSTPRPTDYSWIGGLADNFIQGEEWGRDRRYRREAEGLNRQAVDALMGGQPQQPQSPLGGLMPQGYAGAAQEGQDQFANPQMVQGVTTPGAGISAYGQNVRVAESGGNDQARNPNSTATGRYQFLQGTWDDLMNRYPQLGLTPDGRTDPAQQEKAFAVFTRDNARTLAQNGIQPDSGSLYAAHFLGPQGAVTALTAPDQTPMSAVVGQQVVQANPQLAQMTVGDFKAWASQKGGGGRSAPSGGGAPAVAPSPSGAAPAPANEETRALYAQLLSNPYTARLGTALLERGITPQEYGFANVGGTLVRTDPRTGEATPVYTPEPDPGFRPLSPQEQQQLGLPNDQRFQIGPDGKISQIGGGGTTINVGDGAPGLGKLSADYGYVLDPATGQPVIDPQTGLPRAAAIPGSPAAVEAEQAERARESSGETRARYGSVVMQDIDRALSMIDESPVSTTGQIGDWLSAIGGTGAHDLRNLLTTIGANIGFDRLQQMREDSPTGGALGQVSNFEINQLQAVLGSVQQSQSAEQLRTNLRRLKDVYTEVMRKAAAYPNAAQYGFTSPGGQGEESLDDLLDRYGN